MKDSLVQFDEVVPNADLLMGVKAVWGRSEESVMCFGSRGDEKTKNKAHFSQARITAEKSMSRPYFVTIGAGKEVPPELKGRALELVRSTGVYGETKAFVQNERLYERLSQWPVAVVISEVYEIENEPLLTDDLGMSNLQLLGNAYDSVMRYDDLVEELWHKLSKWPVRRRWEVRRPPNFRDSNKVQLFGSHYPKLDFESSEGKKVWRLSLAAERDSNLRKAAKELNRLKNGGINKCSACGFEDEKDSMFDAHHLEPIAAGERESRVDDLVILCPLCHRWAHAKGQNKLNPVPMDELIAIMKRFPSVTPQLPAPLPPP